jgi:hypothetical protein
VDKINVQLLREHPRNKEFFDDIDGERWEEFKESIKTSGIIVPLIVTEDNIVISGNQRLRAAKELGLSEVPCEVRKYKERGGITAEDWMLKDLIETNLRQRGIGNLNPMKTARCVRELERIYGIKQGRPKKQDTLSGFRVNSSQSQLAETIGITERQLRRLDKLNELIPPSDLGVPVFVVQHMPPVFTESFALGLDRISRLKVKEAYNGEIVSPNTVYIASGGRQMQIYRPLHGHTAVKVSDKPGDALYKPCVDITRFSVAEVYKSGTLGVMLTGMGTDGSRAFEYIKKCGGINIAESESTAVIFGMPNAVISSGNADFVLPSFKIADKNKELVSR